MAVPHLLHSLVLHYDDLVDYIRRRFGDKGFAHEVVHDVCVRIMDEPGRRSEHHPVALLKRMTHHLAIDRYRAESVRQRYLASMAEQVEQAVSMPNFVELIHAQRELQTLAELIEAMPPRRQAVFVMHKIHGLPQASIAHDLEISLKAVEKHIHAAMAQCREGLGR